MLFAFLIAIPIALLGGLIGLGGAEFRLPVLVGPMRYAATKAVPLNLAVSIITVSAALAVRARTLSLASLEPLAPAVVALTAGAVAAAYFGAGWTARLSKERLEHVLLVLLVAIGCLLIVEGFLPERVSALLPASMPVWIGAGIAFGIAIGLVSSMLGVAGGELIIPTLVFAFGADIRTAGTASLLISLPTVAVGLARYWSRGAFADRTPLVKTVAPMGAGSIIGAILGGILVGVVAPSLLKIILGCVLIASAVKTLGSRRRPRDPD